MCENISVKVIKKIIINLGRGVFPPSSRLLLHVERTSKVHFLPVALVVVKASASVVTLGGLWPVVSTEIFFPFLFFFLLVFYTVDFGL